MSASAVSYNLTQGQSRLLSDEEAGWFDAPLILNAGRLMLVEVVFWGPWYPRKTPAGIEMGAWIHLVGTRTERIFYPEQLDVEVSVDELEHWEAWMRGQFACPNCGGNQPQNPSHQPGCDWA